jgi:tRNA A37 threonylcarbamoyltransferase TsaD
MSWWTACARDCASSASGSAGRPRWSSRGGVAVNQPIRRALGRVAAEQGTVLVAPPRNCAPTTAR